MGSVDVRSDTLLLEPARCVPPTGSSPMCSPGTTTWGPKWATPLTRTSRRYPPRPRGLGGQSLCGEFRPKRRNIMLLKASITSYVKVLYSRNYIQGDSGGTLRGVLRLAAASSPFHAVDGTTLGRSRGRSHSYKVPQLEGPRPTGSARSGEVSHWPPVLGGRW